ncbi:MAG TPA: ABC transporter permease [Actinomycetes bacterium]|jgi:ABC-2 type transport system permease protein|nr:ABC transporter permease [Actinomycetes bacterium]
MPPALLIAAKDLRQRLRDASAVVMAIVLPLALAFILSLTLGKATGQGMAFRYAVVDSDHGPLARTLHDEVLAPVEREGLVRLTSAPSADAARSLVERGRVAAAIVVPPGFSAAVRQGGAAKLTVFGDPEQPLATQVARSLAEGYTQLLNGTRLSVATVLHTSGHALDQASVSAVVERASRAGSPVVVLSDVSASSKVLDANTYFAAGMAVFFLFFTVQFGVSSLLEERKAGTLVRLLAAPVRRGAVLSGKLLGAFLLGVVSMTVLVVATGLLLGAHWGDPAGVGLLIVAGVLAALAIMALVATLARTSEQAGNWQAVIALVLGMLGGSFFPLSQAGGFFAKVSLLTPHAWFLRGLGELAGGAGPAAVLPSVGAILAFAVVTGSVAVARLGRFAQP